MNVFQQTMQSEKPLAWQTFGWPTAQAILGIGNISGPFNNDSQDHSFAKSFAVAVQSANQGNPTQGIAIILTALRFDGMDLTGVKNIPSRK